MKFTIRTASAKDAASIHSIYEYYIVHSLATFNEVNKSIEERAHEIESLMKQYPFLVAEDENGSFLGFANAEPFRPQTGYRFTVELTIYLHPDAPKGKGIGTRLYEYLLRMLKEQGYHTAISVLYGGNTASLALHRHFGFEEAALLKNAGYKHGQWIDARIMRKELNPFEQSPALPLPFCEYQKGLTL